DTPRSRRWLATPRGRWPGALLTRDVPNGGQVDQEGSSILRGIGPAEAPGRSEGTLRTGRPGHQALAPPPGPDDGDAPLAVSLGRADGLRDRWQDDQQAVASCVAAVGKAAAHARAGTGAGRERCGQAP